MMLSRLGAEVVMLSRLGSGGAVVVMSRRLGIGESLRRWIVGEARGESRGEMMREPLRGRRPCLGSDCCSASNSAWVMCACMTTEQHRIRFKYGSEIFRLLT